jgi:hypothetical protein
MGTDRDVLMAFGPLTEEQLIEKMHDVIMDRNADPFKTLQARCIKALGPPFMGWVSDERNVRDTEPMDIAMATSSILVNLLVSAALHVAKPGRVTVVSDQMLDWIVNNLYGNIRTVLVERDKIARRKSRRADPTGNIDD